MPLPDEPIRILRVIARLNVGGPALHVSYLSKGLDERGYETTLVAGRVGAGEGSMEYIARESGLLPVYLPELQREISPLADAIAVRKLLELIREVKPHIVHTHTAKAGAVGRAAARLAGADRPQLVCHTFHGHVLQGYFSPVMTRAFTQLERRLARYTDVLIAVSPEVRDDLVRLRVAPREKIVVVRLGLDLQARVEVADGVRDAVRASLGVADGEFLVGWFGRMTEIKRTDDLLAAFARLRAEGLAAVLLLVGDGPLRPSLERRAAELGIAGACRFVGYREEVGPYYAACDAVALTSANEGTPVSIIEAQAAGRPVVSTDVGGVADIVDEGRTGYLVAPGDIEALALRLGMLAGDPAIRVAFGAAGRERVLPRYSVPRLIDDVDRLYRTFLDGPEVCWRRGRSWPRGRREGVVEPLVPTLPARRVEQVEQPLRIVLVSQYFPPEVGATQSRMQAFAEYLAGRGHDVTVICEFPNHPHGVIPERYAGRAVSLDRSNAYKVIRVWVKTHPEKTQATRMAFYLSFMALATAVAPLVRRADVVIATTPPLFTAVAGAAIARLNGAPLVLDVRDLWPAAATSLQQISPGFDTRVAESLERWLYREAAAVVAVTRPFCAHIDGIRSAPPATGLVPNGTLDLFFEEPAAGGREWLGVGGDDFVVTFAGTHGIAQALPAAIQAAPLGPDLHFAYVGDGPMKEIVEAQAREFGVANIRFHPQLPLGEILPVLAASDAMLVTLSAHPTFEQFVPSKLIDFMAVGRPVILSAAGEAARLLELSGAGIVVPPEAPEAVVRAARWLRDHPVEAAEMGLRGRAFARRRMRSVQAERLEAVIMSVVSTARGGV